MLPIEAYQTNKIIFSVAKPDNKIPSASTTIRDTSRPKYIKIPNGPDIKKFFFCLTNGNTQKTF